MRGSGLLQRAVSVAILGAMALGCTTPVAAGLDEEDANRIIVALDHTNIDATKEVDPAIEGAGLKDWRAAMRSLGG